MLELILVGLLAFSTFIILSLLVFIIIKVHGKKNMSMRFMKNSRIVCVMVIILAIINLILLFSI